jgi:hypothetical protein
MRIFSVFIFKLQSINAPRWGSLEANNIKLDVNPKVGQVWGMTRDDPPVRIRLSPELKDSIQQAAKANHRSMNAEIASRLENSLKEPAKGSSWIKTAKLHSKQTPSETDRLITLEEQVNELRSSVEMLLRERLKGFP